MENVYRFDGVLQDVSQEQSYDVLCKPLVLAAIDGYNCAPPLHDHFLGFLYSCVILMMILHFLLKITLLHSKDDSLVRF